MALNLYEIRKATGPGADFFQGVQKQRPGQYQGLYVVSPEGKVLAGYGKSAADEAAWAREVLDAVDRGLKAYGPVAPRKAARVDPQPYLGAGVREDGGIVLAVYGRLMLLGLDHRGLSRPMVDRVELTAGEADSLTLAEADRGSEWAVPPEVVRRFHRVLSPSSDANTLARPDEVTRARLSGRVERVRGGVAQLSFRGRISGEHVWQFEPNKGRKSYADVTLTGAGTCEAKTGKLLSLVLLGDGTFRGHAPSAGTQKYGAVVEWRRKR